MATSMRSMIEEYIDTEHQAYLAQVKADYLRAQADGQALALKVRKQAQRQSS